MDYQDLLNRAYQAFNARDIDSVLALMHSDVDWPNGWEGGYEHGYEAVRTYWTRQWQQLDPYVLPTSFQLRSDGKIEVVVHQVIKDLAGQILSDDQVRHIYTLKGGKIARMDIEYVDNNS